MNGFVGRGIAACIVAIAFAFSFSADARTYRIDGTTWDEGWRIIGKYRVTEQRSGLRITDIAAGQRWAIWDTQPRRNVATEVLLNYANRKQHRPRPSIGKDDWQSINRIADEIVDNRIKHRKRVAELEAKTSVLNDSIAFKKLCPDANRNQLVSYLLRQGHSASAIQYAMREWDEAQRVAKVNASRLASTIKSEKRHSREMAILKKLWIKGDISHEYYTQRVAEWNRIANSR